jgi:hypothetical protein
VLGQVINYGVIAPGNSPGRLTIDGSLDSRGGQIVLEVEQQADGSWRYDELVVTDWLNSLIGDAHVEFAFLGDSDPLTFLNEGMFTLGSFFKQGDGEAGVKPLTDQALGLFIGASFTARSDAYEIRSFRFTVADGASFDIAAIPEPSMLLLVLTALLVAGMRGKPRSRT